MKFQQTILPSLLVACLLPVAAKADIMVTNHTDRPVAAKARKLNLCSGPNPAGVAAANGGTVPIYQSLIFSQCKTKKCYIDVYRSDDCKSNQIATFTVQGSDPFDSSKNTVELVDVLDANYEIYFASPIEIHVRKK